MGFKPGFTLIELLIAMAVAMVTLISASTVYVVQQRQYGNQQLILTARQNLRGGLAVMEQEIRMVGYDPEDSGLFGIVDVRRYDIEVRSKLNIEGQPVLFYTSDVDENGDLDDRGRNRNRNREHPKFRIGDIHKNGRICLTWDNGSGRRPLAEGIIGMGLAYAVDVDGDGRLDSGSGGITPIWAVDSDNDNLLDTDIDTNHDGIIDTSDDANKDNSIDGADGGKLDPPIPLKHIRAVRIWLLAATRRPLKGRHDPRDLVVGDRIVPATSDGCRRFVMESSIMCRNLN